MHGRARKLGPGSESPSQISFEAAATISKMTAQRDRAPQPSRIDPPEGSIRLRSASMKTVASGPRAASSCRRHRSENVTKRRCCLRAGLGSDSLPFEPVRAAFTHGFSCGWTDFVSNAR